MQNKKGLQNNKDNDAITNKSVIMFNSLIFSDLLSADRVLSDLLSTDNGKSSPNSANKYQLEKFAMNPFSFYIHQVGHPYFWVQWICGLNYLPDQEIKSYAPDSCISASHFQSVTKAIKKRLEARLSLQSQLEKLGKKPPEFMLYSDFLGQKL